MNGGRDDLQRGVEKLLAILGDGLDHGFFEIGISGELLHDRKRRLTIRAGNTFRFVIREADLRPLQLTAIPGTGTLNRHHDVPAAIGGTPMRPAQRADPTDGGGLDRARVLGQRSASAVDLWSH
jgi:hypothetical protein